MRLGKVLDMDEGWVVLWVHVAFSADYLASEDVSPRRQLAFHLGLRLNGFCLGEAALEAECTRSESFACVVLALHLELVRLRKEFVHSALKRFRVCHAPLPLIALVAEVFPRHWLRPLCEESGIVALNKWYFPNICIIRL